MFLWLWYRPVATAVIGLLALGPPYVAGAALKRKEKIKLSINNLTVHLKELEKKKKQIKPKISRKKEVIKIRAEINKESTKAIRKMKKTKSWFFKKIKLSSI